MFSEWRKRSKLWNSFMYGSYLYRDEAYDLARAAFKAGVRAGIKQEQARIQAQGFKRTKHTEILAKVVHPKIEHWRNKIG